MNNKDTSVSSHRQHNQILEPLKKPIILPPSLNRISKTAQIHIPKDPIPKTPRTCPMSNEEIAQHSILDSWKQKMPAVEKNSSNRGREYGVLRLAANIIGGGLITGATSQLKRFAGLDGLCSPKENFELWQYLTEDIESDASKEIMEGLDQLKNYASDCENLAEKPVNELELHELALKYSHQIHSLKKGQSLPLYGGWGNRVSGTGHAVIYEFTRVDDDHFDISIVTSTGLQLADSATVGNKRKIQPVVLFSSVPESQIFFSDNKKEISPVFIKSLMGPVVLSEWQPNRHFDEEDILTPFDHLSGYQVNLSAEAYGLVTGQRGGTCVPSSTKQWIRKRTKHLGLYKQFIFRCKFKMLIATYQELEKSLSKDNDIGQLSRNLLKYSTHNLLRGVAKLLNREHESKGLIDPAFALQAQASCYDLLQKIEKWERSIEEEQGKLLPGAVVEKMLPEDQRLLRKNLIDKFSWTSSGKSEEAKTHYIPKDQKIQTAQEFYEKASHFLKNEGNIVQRLSEMHQIIDSAPLPVPPSENCEGLDWIKAIKDPFWSKCSIKELQSCLEVIEKLSKAYPIGNIALPGRIQTTYLALHTLTHYLSLLIEKKMVETGNRKDDENGLLIYYKTRNYAAMTCEKDWEGIVYADSKEHQRIAQCFHYLRSFNGQAVHEEIFAEGGESEVSQWKVKEDPMAGPFWQALIEGDSELKENALRAANKEFPDIGTEAIEKEYQEKLAQYERDLLIYNEQLQKYLKNPEEFSKPFNQPQKPERKVDLPESIKLTLILEEAADREKSDDNVLNQGKKNYNHINVLRRMNQSTDCALKDKSQQNFNVSIRRTCPYSYGCSVERIGFPTKEKDDFGQYALNKCLLPLDSNYEKAFKDEPKFHRASDSWKASSAEGNTLVEKNLQLPAGEINKLKEIIRTLPEWKLAPIQIVTELESDFDLLQDPSYQAMFLHLLFRSPVIFEKKEIRDIRLGLGELIADDQALQKRLPQFINTGLAYFKRKIDAEGNKEKDRTGLNGARFFFSLAFLLANYAKDAGKEVLANQFNYIGQINDWLQQDERGEIFLTTEEKAVLHKNRVLFYSTMPRKDLRPQDFTAIYQSWIVSQMVPWSGKWKNWTEDEAAKNFTLDLYAKHLFPLISVPQGNNLTNAICKGIVLAMKLDTAENEIQWGTPKDNIVSGKKANEGFWNIDFVRGIIYNEKGKIGCGPSNHPWTQQPDFIRLFGGNTRFDYRSLGDKNYTFDSKFGPICLIKKFWGGYAIQRQYDGRDYELMDTTVDILKNKTLGILGKDHNLWIPKKKGDNRPCALLVKNCKPIVGYLSDLEKGERKYALLEDGSVIQVDPASGLPQENSRIIDHLNPEDSGEPLLSRFDENTSILVHRDRRKGYIEKISLPRYVSTEGTPLEFDWKQDRFAWAENSNYVLAKMRPKSLLGSVRQEIYLESANPKEKNKGKLLVPLQFLDADATPFADAKILIANEKRLLPPAKGPVKEQWGCHEYLVFDVNSGVVSASSSEEKLFLAYIYYSQKRFDDAVNLLRQLRPTEPIFQRGMKILEMIQTHPVGEDHPDAKMVLLQALFIQMKRHQESSKVKIEKYVSAPMHLWTILQLLAECPKRLNDISVDCKFSCEDELWLYNTLLEEGKTRENEIAEKLCPPEKLRLKRVLNEIEARKTILVNSKRVGKETPIVSKGRRNRSPKTLKAFDSINKPLRMNCPSKPPTFRPLLESEKEKEKRINKERTEALEYDAQIEKRFGWIRDNTQTSLLDACPPKDFKDGALLCEVLRIAKEGSPWEKRKAMFCLKQWNICSKGHEHGDYLKIMIQILYSPPPNMIIPENRATASTEEIEKLFTSLRQAYSVPEDLSAIEKFICDGKAKIAFGPKGGDYPLTHESVFDTAPPSKKASRRIPISLKGDDNRWKALASWKELYSDAKNTNISEEEKKSEDFSFKFDAQSMISQEEADFRDPLVKALEQLSEDYKEGKKQNEAEKPPHISPDIAKTIFTEAKKNRTKEVEQKIAELTNTLEEKACKKAAEERRKQSEIATIGGKVNKNPTFDDCVRCLMTQDIADYDLMNGNLDEKEMKEIAQLTLLIEDLKSQRAQLLRIEEWCEKIMNINDQNDLNRQYACIRLDHELRARYHFDNFSPEEQIIFRIFSGQTGKIPYEKQMKVIEEMLKVQENNPPRFKHIVAQLIMGGGKTDVIALLAIHLSILRNKDRLGIFIVPSSLFDTVKNNFSENMKKAFGAAVDTIDIEREHLKDDDKLIQILQKLKLAKRDGKPLVAKASSIQCFELELFSVARGVKKTAEIFEKKQEELRKAEARALNLKTASSNLNANQAQYHHAEVESQFQEKVLIPTLKTAVESLQKAIQKLEATSKLLAEIVEEFAQRGDPIGDEVDMMLDCRQEVNFPEGDSSDISPMANELLCEVYKILASNTIIVDQIEGKPTLASVTGIRKNEQSLLNTNTYQTKVVPLVAKILAENYAPLLDELKEHKESFIRYASGIMPAELQKLANDKNFICEETALNEKFPKWKEFLSEDQAEKDIAFLRELASRHSSNDKNRRRLSDLAALSKHILTELTPATLTKSGRRDYGPKPGSDQLEIIPYVAVNAPAKTEFGYHLELACYYLQWILSNPMEEKDLQQIGKTAKEAASYYVAKNGEKLSETCEYIAFKQMFGITFDELNEPEKVKKAIEHISTNLNTLILLAYETIAQNVSERDERYTSNWAALCDLFASFRTMGGTPWNYEGFKAELAKRFMGDLGTEGKIIQTMAKKADQIQIHEVEVEDLDSLFTSIYSDPKTGEGIRPDAHKVRGIIEGGGYFKKFKDNREVAEKMATILQGMQKEKKIDDSIQYVLYYDADTGQHMADTLYALNIQTKTRMRIGGTSLEALQAKGLNPANYFTYFDERHTTGADIPQLPDVIFVTTFDEKKTIRSWLQETMRLRLFLMFQGIEIAVSPRARSQLVNKGATIKDFVISAVKNQTIRKTKDMIRFFRQQIDNIFRRQASLAIRKAALNGKNLADIFAKYERFVLTKTEHDPFLLFGSLKPQIDTKEMLNSYLDTKFEHFKNNAFDMEAINNAALEVKELKQYIQEHVSCLPKNWEDSSGQIGTENEVELQAHVEVQQQIQVDQEIESDVELELKAYEQIKEGEVREDRGMTEHQLKEIIRQLKSEKPTQNNLIRLQEQLKSFSYRFLDEKVPYHKIFKAPIYGTRNYFHTFDSEIPLPVFHKAQRPPKQILAVQTKGGELRYLLLSEREAADVHDILKKMYQENGCPGVWLLDPKFNPLCDGPNCDVIPRPGEKEEPINTAMIEINAFGGFADNLDKNSEYFEKWLLEDESKLRLRFLKLKTARNKRQNEILRHIPCVVGSDDESASGITHHVFKARAEKERLRQGDYTPNSLDEVKQIESNKIARLNVTWINQLHIDWTQRETCKATKCAIEKFKIGNTQEAQNHNKKIYARLKPFQVPYVPASNVDLLPENLIQELKTPEQLAQISEKHVKHLDAKQAPLVPHIRKELYQYFSDTSLIQAIPPTDIKYASPKEIDHFTWAQVQNMPLEWIQYIRKPAQFGWIHGNCLEKIPEQCRHFVSQKQIGMITDPSLIKKLETLKPTKVEEGTWSSWIAPNMVPHIDFNTQLKYLKERNQIKMVPNDHVKALDPALQVPLIEAFQVPFLMKEQIPFCPDNFVQNIPAEMVCHTVEKQIPLLRGNGQIQKVVDPTRFALLKAENNTQYGFVNQMEWINDDQLKLVSKQQIPGLSPAQIEKLAGFIEKKQWSNLREALTAAQIQRFDSEAQIKLLSREQIDAHLADNQVRLLVTKEMIRKCPNRLVKRLNEATQVPHISDEQIPFLEGVYQVQSLKEEPKFKHLAPYQMQWINDDQLKMVSTEQVSGLSTEQIVKLSGQKSIIEWSALRRGLTQAQIQRFNTAEQIELLADDQIRNHIAENQVPLLRNQRTIRACPDNFVQRLNVETQIPHIAPQQVPHLEGKEQVDACPRTKDHIEQLQQAHLQFLFVDRENPHALVTQFPKETIGNVTEIKHLCLIDYKLWRYLPANEVLIRKIPYGALQHLTKEQLALLPGRQRLVYAIGVTVLGIVGSIATVLFHISLIRLATYCFNRDMDRRLCRILHSHPQRLYRYFNPVEAPI